MDQNYDENVQRWVILTQNILGAKDINATDKILLAHISGFEKFYASNETTANFLGLTTRNVQVIKQKLVKLGYIKILKDTGRGKIYQFNFERLSKFCQSDYQNFDNQTIKKMTTYNKDKIKEKEKGNSSVEKSKKEYGRADINELEDLWESETGISIKGQQNQRRQLYNLLRKYGSDAIKTLIRRVGVATRSRDRFAPQIAMPSDLTGKYSKLTKLQMWENRNKYARPFGSPAPVPVSKGIPDYNGAWDEQSDEERAKVSEMMRQAKQKMGF